MDKVIVTEGLGADYVPPWLPVELRRSSYVHCGLTGSPCRWPKIIVIKGLGANYVSPLLPVHIDPQEKPRRFAHQKQKSFLRATKDKSLVINAKYFLKYISHLTFKTGTRNSYKQRLHKFSGNVSSTQRGSLHHGHERDHWSLSRRARIKPWTPVPTAHRLKGSGEELSIPWRGSSNGY